MAPAALKAFAATITPSKSSFTSSACTEHYARLRQSAHILMIEIPHTRRGELGEITKECIRRSGLRTDVYMRPSAYKSSEIIGVRLHNLEDDLYVTVQPFGNYIDIDRAAARRGVLLAARGRQHDPGAGQDHRRLHQQRLRQDRGAD